MPEAFGGLGLDAAALQSHIAWDPGALGVAMAMVEALDAPLVHSNASRLIYDCNRPPEARRRDPGAKRRTPIFPATRVLTRLNGRGGSTGSIARSRGCWSDQLDARAQPPVLVTIHSFTPVFLGKARDVEIGVLHDIDDTRLADALLAVPLDGSCAGTNHTDPVMGSCIPCGCTRCRVG